MSFVAFWEEGGVVVGLAATLLEMKLSLLLSEPTGWSQLLELSVFRSDDLMIPGVCVLP